MRTYRVLVYEQRQVAAATVIGINETGDLQAIPLEDEQPATTLGYLVSDTTVDGDDPVSAVRNMLEEHDEATKRLSEETQIDNQSVKA